MQLRGSSHSRPAETGCCAHQILAGRALYFTGYAKKIKEQTQRLYEGFVEGQLNRETYIAQKTTLQRRSEEISDKAESVKQDSSAAITNNNLFVESYSKYMELDKLTSAIAADLLDRVTVWPDGRLNISLNYLDELAKIC